MVSPPELSLYLQHPLLVVGKYIFNGGSAQKGNKQIGYEEKRGNTTSEEEDFCHGIFLPVLASASRSVREVAFNREAWPDS